MQEKQSSPPVSFLQAFSIKCIFQSLPGFCAGTLVEYLSLGIEPGFTEKGADHINGFVTGIRHAVAVCWLIINLRLMQSVNILDCLLFWSYSLFLIRCVERMKAAHTL